ncbi:MAG: ABC transporter ATP-binding protein, partial [Clostridia bacterium]|nr:ABC transporter ATP-binding protein [Clostridia bacterium]
MSEPKRMPGPRGMRGPRQEVPKGTFGRIVKALFKAYPGYATLTVICTLLSAFVTAIPATFQQRVLDALVNALDGGLTWDETKTQILPLVFLLIGLYVVSLTLMTVQSQVAAIMTQGFLNKMRCAMFDDMQSLPIRFFDRKKAGDVMSYYTNDIDTLRQLVSQSLPNLLRSGVIVLTVLFIMLWYSLYMTLIIMVGVVAMFFVSKKIGGGSAKYFVRQQQSVGKVEGYVQEMMNGQKVVKVFCHEDRAKADFDAINDDLYHDAYRAHGYANSMGPIIMNIGNVLYVICAAVGGLFLLSGLKNVSISGYAFSIGIIVSYLNMTKQFTGNLNQVSQQFSAIAMGLAGAGRVFTLMDEKAEDDNGYVTLVNAVENPDGSVTETAEHTGRWAWKHPHGDGTLTYTPLRGDVQLLDVDFSYIEGKQVLYDVSVYA